MPWLRTAGILNDIHTVFDESDYDLKAYEDPDQNNQDKLQLCFNINGTATVVGQCEWGAVLHMTFEGNGRVELWDGRRRTYFFIDRNKYSIEEIRKRFHEKTTEYFGLAFKDGGYQLLPANYSGKLATIKILRQVYNVFSELDLLSSAPISYFSKDVPPQFECGVDGNGKLVLRVWTEIREQCPGFSYEHRWEGKQICIIFDESDYVTITKSAYTNDGQQVPVHQVKEYLWGTYRRL